MNVRHYSFTLHNLKPLLNVNCACEARGVMLQGSSKKSIFLDYQVHLSDSKQDAREDGTTIADQELLEGLKLNLF